MINRNDLKKALDELNAFKKRKKTKYNFYSYDNAHNQYDFDIFFSLSTRSAGKTTATQREICLQNFYDSKSQFIKLCRFKDELRHVHQANWWTAIIESTLKKNNIAIKYKGNKYIINNISDYTNENGVLNESEFIKNGEVIGYVIPIAQEQRYKSINYENCSTIIFDEFAKKESYSYGITEIDDFKSFLSTVVRMRNDVKVYFAGNILNPDNPYFAEFGIDALQLQKGHTYCFMNTEQYDEPCIVVVEFAESVTNEIDNIPRLLRLPNNAQVTGMNEYDLPSEVIAYDDWLLIALESKELFEEFYVVKCELVTSVDETKNLKKNSTGNYIFENVSYYLINDIYNDKSYLIRKNKSEDYGLFINEKFDVPKYKYADDDIRNQLPLFDERKMKSKVIYGDIELLRLLRERRRS